MTSTRDADSRRPFVLQVSAVPYEQERNSWPNGKDDVTTEEDIPAKAPLELADSVPVDETRLTEVRRETTDDE